MNKVILMGRLTKDPELRYSQGAQPIAITRYTLAVNRVFKREGEPDADFINVVAFSNRGEFAAKYFKKGMMVGIVGQIRVNSFDDKDGNRRWTTDVIVDEQYFAESRASFEAHSSSNNNNFARDEQTSQSYIPKPNNDDKDGFYPIDEELDDDDLPF